MKQIWKFPLQVASEQTVNMPVGAVVLHTDTQDDVIMLWAIVNPDVRMEQVTFEMYGTGNQLPDDITRHVYVGTVQRHAFVWHIFRSLRK
jgi:hypothetical protein